ncbi:pyridoxamine 5'-phosphate oxidase family protein [Stakelama sediminis]|uniref:General stress protein 26 n=1 Tax=Stakelama sediminis TaxID=463200 RepID=A0A840Z077_9SPHN|nr:pyridoxamine 5'-phosphate oxidase family protein [Stakelama sediminis]MBB5719511.1 general stress protein 26 [Stakelama sediminis]
MTDTSEIRTHMWKALADSPFLMIGLTDKSAPSEPMTAQLDKDADSAFWFYTSKRNRLAGGGPAMAHFSAKGHGLFACISGTLTQETDSTVIDKHWSNAVEAWFDGGRDDPDMMMLRFDLDDAEIWQADASIKGVFNMLTGRTMRGDEMGRHTETAL